MKKLLFICHGNICRSPMAEFIFRDLVEKRGLASDFEIGSAATSREEIGNPIYPRAKSELNRHGISCQGHRARQVTPEDYAHYDYLVYMEQYNEPRLMKILGRDPEGKCRRLMDFSDRPGDIDDPWYTGDFAGVFQQISYGCQALLEKVGEDHGF